MTEQQTPGSVPTQDLDYATLDHGIRDVVRGLVALGYDTTDSGDGVSKTGMGCALPYRHVVAMVPSTVVRLSDAARFAENMRRDIERITATEWMVEVGYSTHGGSWTAVASEQIDGVGSDD